MIDIIEVKLTRRIGDVVFSETLTLDTKTVLEGGERGTTDILRTKIEQLASLTSNVGIAAQERRPSEKRYTLASCIEHTTSPAYNRFNACLNCGGSRGEHAAALNELSSFVEVEERVYDEAQEATFIPFIDTQFGDTDSMYCSKCQAIHDGGKFNRCQVCGAKWTNAVDSSPKVG